MNSKGKTFLAALVVLAMAFAVFSAVLPANDADEGITIAPLDRDAYLWNIHPVSELIGEDFGFTLVSHDKYTYDVKVSGTVLWYDDLGMFEPGDEYRHYDFGYFIPIHIALPSSYSFDDVTATLTTITYSYQYDTPVTDPNFALILEPANDYVLTIGDNIDGAVYTFKLSNVHYDIHYQPTGEYIEDVSEYKGVIHGFADKYTDDIFVVAYFAYNAVPPTAEVFYLGADPESKGQAVGYIPINNHDKEIEYLIWTPYDELDPDHLYGDGYYRVVIHDNGWEDRSVLLQKGVVEDAIFVDAVNGDDKNDGTKASPVKTIEKAIELLGEDVNKIVLLSDYTAEGDIIELSELTVDLNGNNFTVARPVAIAEDKIVTIVDSAKKKGAMYIGKDGFGDVALFNMGTITVDGAAVYADILHVAYASYLAQGTLGEIVATSAAFIYGDKDWDKGSEWSVWVGDADDSYFALGEGINAIVTQEGPTSALISILAASEPDSATEVAPFAEVRGDFVTNGVDIEIGENVTVTVLGSIELSIFEGESVTEVSDIVVDKGASLVSGIDPDGNLAPVKMWKGTAISLMNGATFSGIIEAGVGTAEYSKADGSFTAGEKGIRIIAGSITITGELDATTADAILENAEGTVILDGLTVIGDGNKLRINDGKVIIENLALDGCDVVIAEHAQVVIDGPITSIGEAESTIIADADSIITTGSADIEVEIDTGDNYPEYKDGDRVMKDGTMFTIGHVQASSGRIVQFGVALSVLVFDGDDHKGKIKNATVTSFDNFYKYTSAGMPDASVWAAKGDKVTPCIHAGYYVLEVYFGVTNNVTTTTVHAFMENGALIAQASSDVTLVEYEAAKVYDAKVTDLGTFDLTSTEEYVYDMTGIIMFYNGTWAPGTWPEDMSKGYYAVFQVEGLQEYIAEFPNATFMLVDSGWKAFDGFLLKFIGTTLLDVDEFNETPFEFYLDNDGIGGEFDDYKPTLYTINMDLTAYGYDVTVALIDDDYEGVPVNDLISDDFELTIVPANSDNGQEQYNVYVSGTIYWYDGMPLETDVESYKYGYFVPFQIILPESKTFDDVDYVVMAIPGVEPYVLDKVAKHILLLEVSRVFTLTVGIEGQDYVFNFDLEAEESEVVYETIGDYIANVSGYQGVIHGFPGDYVNDMFYIVFADTFTKNQCGFSVYYLGMDPTSQGSMCILEAVYMPGFEKIAWIPYNSMWLQPGDGYYRVTAYDFVTLEAKSLIVMRGNGINFVWNEEVSDSVMDCGENGENFSAIIAQEPDTDGVYHVDFTGNTLYYVPQWIIDDYTEFVNCKAGYYLGFEIDYANAILTEDAIVTFPDATLENPIGFKYDTGLYFVYLGSNKAALQDRYITIDADGDGELAPADFKLCVCGADEEVAIGFAAAGIILKDTYVDDAGVKHDYDDIYLNCENGDYIKLPDGKDSTRNFVRWDIEAPEARAYNWDSIYIVSWYDDCNIDDGQIVFTAVYDDTPGPQPVVTEYTIKVNYVCDGELIYSPEPEVVIEGQYYFFECDVPELKDYIVPRDYVAGKAFADETIVIECFEKTVADDYRLLITTSKADQVTYVDYVLVADGYMEAGVYEFSLTGKYIDYDDELELYTVETETITFTAEIAFDAMFFVGSFDYSVMENFDDLYSIVLECITLGVTSVVASQEQ